MKGRQQGRPTKWVTGTIMEQLGIGKQGIQFEVWEKWKKKDTKVGTLLVTVGGIRWRPGKGKLSKQKTWSALAEWLSRTAQA